MQLDDLYLDNFDTGKIRPLLPNTHMKYNEHIAYKLPMKKVSYKVEMTFLLDYHNITQATSRSAADYVLE